MFAATCACGCNKFFCVNSSGIGCAPNADPDCIKTPRPRCDGCNGLPLDLTVVVAGGGAITGGGGGGGGGGFGFGMAMVIGP